jgi:hypothetical protein
MKYFVLLLMPFILFGQYDLVKDVISSGGTKATSTNYVLYGTISQTTIGSVAGGNYKGIIGFWQPFDWIAPNDPFIVKVNKSSNNVVLTWNKIITDVNGNPEIIQYYSVYRDTIPNYFSGTANFVGNSSGPDTTYTDVGSLNSTKSYYYLVKAVDYGMNRSGSSNMGFKFNKFFNENAGATSDRNWVSLPWQTNYTVVDNLVNDLSAGGDPLVIVTNMRNDQLYESYVWDQDFGWYGDNFNITSGRGFEMVTTRDTILWIVGADNPNSLITLNENPGAVSDRNWVSVPYNAAYSTVSNVTDEYSPAGDPLIILTNMRNDQLYESYIWDQDFGWYGDDFVLERGRAFEFVAIRDTTWNPTEYSNDVFAVILANKKKSKNSDVVVKAGKSIQSDRNPRWVTEDGLAGIDLKKVKAYKRATARNDMIDKERRNGESHVVSARLNDIKTFNNIVFTAYRLSRPSDVLTEKNIGCGTLRKDNKGAIWFNTGNFKSPWIPGEQIILIVEALKQDKGYAGTVNFRLDKGVDLQQIGEIALLPIPEPRTEDTRACWKSTDDINVIGYSLYRHGECLNTSIIEGAEYSNVGACNLRQVFVGGYETVYASSGNKLASASGVSTSPINYACAVAPNPFAKKTIIKYALPHTANIEINVYDVSGRRVKNLITQRSDAGYYQTDWRGDDSAGRQVAGGIYFVRVQTEDFNSQHKVVFVR